METGFYIFRGAQVPCAPPSYFNAYLPPMCILTLWRIICRSIIVSLFLSVHDDATVTRDVRSRLWHDLIIAPHNDVIILLLLYTYFDSSRLCSAAVLIWYDRITTYYDIMYTRTIVMVYCYGIIIIYYYILL